jgi:hypothetical protein
MTPHNEKRMELLEWCRANVCTPDGKRVCLLCKYEHTIRGERVVVGVFIADDKNQKRLGASQGKERLVIYVLCVDCHERPDRNEQVEQKIFAAIGVQ